MITPRFNCSQTESSVIISMYCPSIRASDVEIHVDDTLVTVHANPYFLRLNFPRAVEEDDDPSARYDPASGYLTVTLTKLKAGEVFDDLDLLAKLLAPRKTAKDTLANIEVLSSSINLENEVDELSSKAGGLSLEDDEPSDENDWNFPQSVPEDTPLRTSLQARYGFLDIHSSYLNYGTHTENEINELGDDAEICTKTERRERRAKHEDEKFDEEHYIADFMDDDYIKELLQWVHPHIANDEPIQYTEKENLQLSSLPKREYLATSAQTHDLYLTLVTLLFAYAYESRTSQHDPTSESAWTICSLTPAFSALDPPHSVLFKGGVHVFPLEELRETLVPSYRRSLAFPLYRSFALAEKCKQDVAQLLRKGKRTVARCLLEMKYILDHEVYYIYSKIWVDDFCVWIQADADDTIIEQLGESLMDCMMDKSSIGWGLLELEAIALSSADRSVDSDDESGDSA